MKRSDFVESGREGGKIAASRMTPKQRSERARKAALAKTKHAKAEGESMKPKTVQQERQAILETAASGFSKLMTVTVSGKVTPEQSKRQGRNIEQALRSTGLRGKP